MAATEIQTIIDGFVNRLSAALEAQAVARVQAAVLTAIGAQAKRGPGRPPKNALVPFAPVLVRRAPPKQLCPVPGCKNAAAPVFGMVCSDHRSVPKAKIKEYREARRKAKEASRQTGRARTNGA